MHHNHTPTSREYITLDQRHLICDVRGNECLIGYGKHLIAHSFNSRTSHSDKKRQHPATTQDELGITCIMDDFATHRTATVTLRAERCDFIREELRKCEEMDRLTPGLAKELFGKLSFCLQSLFGRVGRASALPLLKRCYDNTDTSFGDELKEMRLFFDLVLAKHNLPSKTFRLGTPAQTPAPSSTPHPSTSHPSTPPSSTPHPSTPPQSSPHSHGPTAHVRLYACEASSH